mgnify:FL=1
MNNELHKKRKENTRLKNLAYTELRNFLNSNEVQLTDFVKRYNTLNRIKQTEINYQNFRNKLNGSGFTPKEFSSVLKLKELVEMELLKKQNKELEKVLSHELSESDVHN